jgi:Protein of unknown function (DUF4019)
MRGVLDMRVWACLLWLLLAPLASASEKTDQAVAAASRWLRQLDQQQYQEAYGASSAALRGKVTYEAWLGGVQANRGVLGAIRKRELIFGALEKELPGLPRGDYARLRFRSDFAKKYEVLEQLTLILEPDGSWHVLGYSVQPEEKGQ